MLTMRQNQKYFPLVDGQGRLSNRFLVVSNMEIDEPRQIVRGNERVLRARLFEQGAVRSEKVRPDGAFRLRVVMPRERLHRALREAGLEPSRAGLR